MILLQELWEYPVEISLSNQQEYYFDELLKLFVKIFIFIHTHHKYESFL